MAHGTGPHIVVIGAGIVGASLAYHLASKGTKVGGVDANAALAARAFSQHAAASNTPASTSI
nr:FAD-dependent oxidoreductase [Pseudomonas antarctica]